MKELIEIRQIERQLILYDVFRFFDRVTYGDIRFVLEDVEKRTLQRDIRDLMDAGLILVKYSKPEKAYIRLGTPTWEINSKNSISKKKMQHLKRLQRLASCMWLIEDANPVKTYFEEFPEASEKMRQRDFETLRNIGFEAGYDRDYQGYSISNKICNPYDGYGVFLKNGKRVRYL